MAPRLQVVFDAADPARLAEFWIAALHYQQPEPPPPHKSWDDWARAEGIPEDRWNDARAVEDPAGEGPRVFIQRVPEPKVAKNRMHLDLHVADAEATAQELEALGASRLGSGSIGEIRWITMADPEGNEFDLAWDPHT